MSCLSKSGAAQTNEDLQSFQILMDANFHLVQYQPNTDEFELNYLDENA